MQGRGRRNRGTPQNTNKDAQSEEVENTPSWRARDEPDEPGDETVAAGDPHGTLERLRNEGNERVDDMNLVGQNRRPRGQLDPQETSRDVEGDRRPQSDGDSSVGYDGRGGTDGTTSDTR
jgi:hypothetical protein